MLLSLVLILSRYVLKNMPVDKRIALQLKKLGQRPIKTPVVARPWNERNGNCLSFTLTQLMQSACQLPAVCYVYSVRVGVGRRTHRLSNTPRESVPVVSVLCGVFLCVLDIFYIYIDTHLIQILCSPAVRLWFFVCLFGFWRATYYTDSTVSAVCSVFVQNNKRTLYSTLS